MTTKDFKTADVLSTITGVLVSEMGGIHEVLEWMTGGESIFTHQLPRISREAATCILSVHPELQAAVEESESITKDNWQEWRDKWLARYGDTISVPQFSGAEHRIVGPISELAEMMGPDRIAVVTA